MRVVGEWQKDQKIHGGTVSKGKGAGPASGHVPLKASGTKTRKATAAEKRAAGLSGDAEPVTEGADRRLFVPRVG